MSITVYTIGHSTRRFDEFLVILQRFRIEEIVDVRAIPRSHYNPQFGQDVLKTNLEDNGIDYTHLVGLGGLRSATGATTNAGWKNRSFRGYADHMQTAQFKNALEQLIDIAREQSTAVMCAETLPWRCHRSLIGDALLVRGFTVEDIIDDKVSKPHKMTPWARVVGDAITYPGTTI